MKTVINKGLLVLIGTGLFLWLAGILASGLAMALYGAAALIVLNPIKTLLFVLAWDVFDHFTDDDG